MNPTDPIYQLQAPPDYQGATYRLRFYNKGTAPKSVKERYDYLRSVDRTTDSRAIAAEWVV
jgi:hypothetical protein